MKMYVGGEWIDKSDVAVVANPFDNSTIDTVPAGDLEDVQTAIASAVRGAKVMANMPAYDRHKFLRRASDLMAEKADDMARTITMEEGKILAESRIEVVRGVETLSLSAEEAKRITGETLQLDAAPGGVGKFGFTIRVPCGVVAAIAPFNFPLHLVCHKVCPALAAGNSVIIKPASDTPLTSLKLTEILLEAGAPPESVQCLTGSGAVVGDALVSDPRVRKVSFTGSRDIGERILKLAGIKKVTMELGSNAPIIVLADADMKKVAEATVATGYANAGQVCISAQRVLTDRRVSDDFLDALKEQVATITVGDPLKDGTRMGPMVRESDAIRVNSWIQEAVSGGARLVYGGEREGTLHQPTIVADVDPSMRISRDELFGPAVAVTSVADIDEAIALANDTIYGLSAGIFTQNIDHALRFAQEVHSGNLHINWGPGWRVDMMPYGGLKESGIGKEGPRYAVEEMTETKMVVVHQT